MQLAFTSFDISQFTVHIRKDLYVLLPEGILPLFVFGKYLNAYALFTGIAIIPSFSSSTIVYGYAHIRKIDAEKW